MAKRQQVTKLLAVMAMTSSPALAGPEHGHAHGPGPAPPAARAPAPKPSEDAAPARTEPRPRREVPAARAPAGAPATSAVAAVAPPPPVAAPAIDAILALFGLARVRELPNGRPAPGNVTSRAPSGKLR
jgi:hypothetical protein